MNGGEVQWWRARRTVLLAAIPVALVVLVVSALAVANARHQRAVRARERSVREAQATVTSYLAAWSRGDYGAMRAITDAPPVDFDEYHRKAAAALHATTSSYKGDRVRVRGSAATAGFAADVHLEGLGPWRYRGSLAMGRVQKRWLVRWTPATVHPALRPGLQLARQRTVPSRAPVLAADGQPLTTAVAGGVRDVTA
jgi:hypothetical protein